MLSAYSLYYTPNFNIEENVMNVITERTIFSSHLLKTRVILERKCLNVGNGGMPFSPYKHFIYLWIIHNSEIP
jgi:hypothetical protein